MRLFAYVPRILPMCLSYASVLLLGLGLMGGAGEVLAYTKNDCRKHGGKRICKKPRNVGKWTFSFLVCSREDLVNDNSGYYGPVFDSTQESTATAAMLQSRAGKCGKILDQGEWDKTSTPLHYISDQESCNGGFVYPTVQYPGVDQSTGLLLAATRKYRVELSTCDDTPVERILYGHKQRTIDSSKFRCGKNYRLTADRARCVLAPRQPKKNLGNCTTCDAPAGSAQTPFPTTIANGNKFKTMTDYQGQGAFPLEFTRYYNFYAEQLTDDNSTRDYIIQPFDSHNYSRKLSFDLMSIPLWNDSDGLADIRMFDPTYTPVAGTPMLSSTSDVVYEDDDSGDGENDTEDTFLVSSTGGYLPAPAVLFRTVEITRPDGRAVTAYQREGSANWHMDADVKGRFVELANQGGYEYFAADGTREHYSALGALEWIESAEKLRHTITKTQNTDGTQLMTITHSNGAQLKVLFATDGKLISSTDPSGGVTTYTYTNGTPYQADGLLRKVTYPDGKAVKYYYMNPADYGSLPRALVKIQDENTQESADSPSNITNFYESYDYVPDYNEASLGAGRVQSTNFINNVNRFVFNYRSANQAQTVRGNLASTYDFVEVLGVKRVSHILREDLGLQSHEHSYYTYDASGNYASITDWSGNKTCYAHNSRNLEILRIEGLPSDADCTAMTAANSVLPANTRKTTKAYHPTFNLITQLVEPTRTTDIVYDDKAHILSKTVTDTTNTNAADPLRTRAWNYTYTYAAAPSDPIIRKVIEDGPRTDVADTTTYDFDAQGNLTKITNALGEITQYSNYGANGRVGKIIDPNGLETSYTYTPRGWLSSKTQGNASAGLRTTTFEYDGVGQLTKATNPDGSFTRYEYDAAHRLVALYDAAGNSIKYQLDAMGNITEQTVNDTTGNLTQTAAAAMPNSNPLPVLAFLNPSAFATLQ